MTPNKLPPLPEPNEAWLPTHTMAYYTADQMHAYAAEALRQSQSLPAGAVAEGDWYTSEQGSHIVDFDQDPANQLSILLKRDGTVSAVATKNGNDTCGGYGLDEVSDVIRSYALQADAREKGEIADLESDIDTLVDHNMALQSAIRDAIKIHSSFGTTADMADWLRDELEALATQPAQASEKDGCVSVPRDALLTEARRLRYRATETYGLGPAMTDAGAQMIHTAEALEGFASSGQEKK